MNRTRRARTAAILATIVLASVLSGCGSAGDILSSPTGGSSPSSGTTPSASAATATAAPTAAPLPAGWTRTTVAVDGYSIGTPKDWAPVALGGQDIDALIAGFRTTNPELAAILQQARDSGQSFSFMAIATDPALIGNTGFSPNVNVIISGSQGYDSAFIATASVIQLKKLASLEGEIQDIAVACRPTRAPTGCVITSSSTRRSRRSPRCT